MMRSVRAALTVMALALAAPAWAEVTNVPNTDVMMAAAIDKAKATLPLFFERLAHPEPGDEKFSVKIRFPTTGDAGEHIWADDVSVAGDEVTATIANVPHNLPALKYGQKVVVPKGQITDWMYIHEGKIHGGQTLRAVLPRMPPEQANRYRAMLVPE